VQGPGDGGERVTDAVVALVLNIVLTIGLLTSALTKNRKVTSGICVDCGYDLSGLGVAGRCPECGQVFVPQDISEVNLVVRRRSPEIIWATLPAAALFMLLDAIGVLGALPYRALGYSWAVAMRAPVARGEGSAEAQWWLVSAFLGFAPLIGTLPRSARPFWVFGIAFACVLAINALVWAS